MIIDSSDDEDFECTKETTPEIRDIDTGNDIFFVTEYASEIFQYLKQSEVIFCSFLECYTHSVENLTHASFKISCACSWMCARVCSTVDHEME